MKLLVIILISVSSLTIAQPPVAIAEEKKAQEQNFHKQRVFLFERAYKREYLEDLRKHAMAAAQLAITTEQRITANQVATRYFEALKEAHSDAKETAQAFHKFLLASQSTAIQTK